MCRGKFSIYTHGADFITCSPLRSLFSKVNGESSALTSSPDHASAIFRCFLCEAVFMLNEFNHLNKL